MDKRSDCQEMINTLKRQDTRLTQQTDKTTWQKMRGNVKNTMRMKEQKTGEGGVKSHLHNGKGWKG